MITHTQFEALQKKVAELNQTYHLIDSNERIIIKRLEDQSVEINDFTETNQYFDYNSAIKRLDNIEYSLVDLM